MNEYEEAVKEVLSGKYNSLELEVEDIALRLPIDKLDDEVKENIKYILEKSGLWRDDLSISVGPSPVDVSCSDEPPFECLVTHDFTIYGENGWKVIAHGTAYTSYYHEEDENYIDVSSTYIVMDRDSVKKLYEYVNKSKVPITT